MRTALALTTIIALVVIGLGLLGYSLWLLRRSHTPSGTYPPVSGYRVYRDDVGFLYRAFGTVFVDASVTNGVAHVYTVTALDSRGNESPLSWGGTATGSADLVNPPGGLAGTVGAAGITLSWTAPAAPGEAPGGPVSGYVILKATCASGCELSSSWYVGAGTLSFTDTTAEPAATPLTVTDLASAPCTAPAPTTV